MNQEEVISEFGRAITESVRDLSIQDADAMAAGRMNDPSGRRWAALLDRVPASREETQTLVHALIPDIVDDVIFRVLNAIDQDLLQLRWINQEGQTIDLNAEYGGELGGYYVGIWREELTRERFNDPSPH